MLLSRFVRPKPARLEANPNDRLLFSRIEGPSLTTPLPSLEGNDRLSKHLVRVLAHTRLFLSAFVAPLDPKGIGGGCVCVQRNWDGSEQAEEDLEREFAGKPLTVERLKDTGEKQGQRGKQAQTPSEGLSYTQSATSEAPPTRGLGFGGWPSSVTTHNGHRSK